MFWSKKAPQPPLSHVPVGELLPYLVRLEWRIVAAMRDRQGKVEKLIATLRTVERVAIAEWLRANYPKDIAVQEAAAALNNGNTYIPSPLKDLASHIASEFHLMENTGRLILKEEEQKLTEQP